MCRTFTQRHEIIFFLTLYYVTHCRVNVFKVPFIFVFLTSPCITVFLFLKSGDFASGDMTVSLRVWLSGRDDFCREWYNSTYRPSGLVVNLHTC